LYARVAGPSGGTTSGHGGTYPDERADAEAIMVRSLETVIVGGGQAIAAAISGEG